MSVYLPNFGVCFSFAVIVGTNVKSAGITNPKHPSDPVLQTSEKVSFVMK